MLALGDLEAEALELGLTLADGETEADGLTDGLVDLEAEELGLTLALGETERLAEADGETLALGDDIASPTNVHTADVVVPTLIYVFRVSRSSS